MNPKRFHILLALTLVIGATLATPAAAKSEKDDGEVIGHFSPGGMLLTVTSQSEFEQLWYLAIDYCDGRHEEINARRFPSKLPGIVSLGAQGYSFYADKPMRRAVIKSLPIPETGGPAVDFRFTQVQRKCGNPDPPPQLYCNDVQVGRVIHRSWEGEAIEFKSNRHVMRAGLSFPGVDGLAPTRQPIYNLRIYQPGVRFDPVDRTWTGTFISLWVPVGEYEKVVLIVQDDFGQQAKCPLGDIRVLP